MIISALNDMIEYKKYVIFGIDAAGNSDNPNYSIISVTIEGKEGFRGTHGAGAITEVCPTVEGAEQALLTELQRRITGESVKATKRAADLAKLAFDLSNTGFKGYKADP
jgi:hypothetical protein